MADITNSYCNNCIGYRRHEVLHKEEKSWHEDLDENGEPITHINYYPPALYRKKPKWINDLVWSLGFFTSDIINEIYVALQNNSHRLVSQFTLINKG